MTHRIVTKIRWLENAAKKKDAFPQIGIFSNLIYYYKHNENFLSKTYKIHKHIQTGPHMRTHTNAHPIGIETKQAQHFDS